MIYGHDEQIPPDYHNWSCIQSYPDLTKQDSAELQEYLAIHQNAQRDV